MGGRAVPTRAPEFRCVAFDAESMDSAPTQYQRDRKDIDQLRTRFMRVRGAAIRVRYKYCLELDPSALVFDRGWREEEETKSVAI